MKLIPTPIEDLLIIQHDIWRDERGYFMESFQKKRFEEAGIHADFVQDNLSVSAKGVLRGLHAQREPQAQGKLVRVIQGKVWDVAVDIRAGSPTFGNHYGLTLQENDGLSFWIPPGFLHGFVALEDDTVFTYKVSGYYDRENEFGVRWDDPTLQITWPLEAGPFHLSEKDLQLPYFDQIAR